MPKRMKANSTAYKRETTWCTVGILTEGLENAILCLGLRGERMTKVHDLYWWLDMRCGSTDCVSISVKLLREYSHYLE